MASGSSSVLEIRHVSVEYTGGPRPIPAVQDVSLTIRQGEFFGLAGESGSGKSTLALAVTRLLSPSVARVQGEVRLAGADLLRLPPRELRKVRWKQVSFVFQSAMNALNPILTVEEQMVDAILAHEPMTRSQARELAVESLRSVGIPASRLRSYPHQLSGGMRQRVVIASALALRPQLVILDEPTTALDVVVQREILQLVKELQSQLQFAVLFITHDFSLLVETADHIAVMYAGRMVEMGPARALYTYPLHPYTRGLISSFPPLHRTVAHLEGIPGYPPDLGQLPPGCAFHPRCPQAMPICRQVVPPWRDQGDHRAAACHAIQSDARPAASKAAEGGVPPS